MFGKPSLKGDVTSPDNLFKFQAMVMRELAEQEPCVFVGRAAGYVLDQDEEIENLIRIFVYADRVRRVQRVVTDYANVLRGRELPRNLHP